MREDQIKKRMNPDEAWAFHHQVTGSVHSEHRVWILPRLTGSLGLSDNFMVFNHLEDVEHAPGSSAGLTWQAGRDVAVFGSVGRGTRFPTLSQLWGSLSGNRDLRPETTTRTELGIDGRWGPSVGLETAVFWNDLEDLIDRDVRRAGRYRNIASARSWGAEIAGKIHPGEWLKARLSYAYTRTEDRDTGDPLDRIPRHKLDAEVSIESRDGDAEWTLIVSRVGERFDSNSLEPDRMLPRYVTADCKVRTRVADRTTLSLEIFNIADQNYEEEVGYPAPGRTVWVSGDVRF